METIVALLMEGRYTQRRELIDDIRAELGGRQTVQRHFDPRWEEERRTFRAEPKCRPQNLKPKRSKFKLRFLFLFFLFFDLRYFGHFIQIQHRLSQRKVFESIHLLEIGLDCSLVTSFQILASEIPPDRLIIKSIDYCQSEKWFKVQLKVK